MRVCIRVPFPSLARSRRVVQAAAHLVCRVVSQCPDELVDDGGHKLLVCDVVAAWVRPEYWTDGGGQLAPTSVLGSGRGDAGGVGGVGGRGGGGGDGGGGDGGGGGGDDEVVVGGGDDCDGGAAASAQAAVAANRAAVCGAIAAVRDLLLPRCLSFLGSQRFAAMHPLAGSPRKMTKMATRR